MRCCVFLFCLLSFHSLASDLVHTVLESKFTHIDLDRDGKYEFVRRPDGSIRMIQGKTKTVITSSEDRHEILITQNDKPIYKIERVKKGLFWESVVESYRNLKKVQMARDNSKWVQSISNLKQGQWQEFSKKEQPYTLNQSQGTQLRATNILAEYARCLENEYEVNPDTCMLQIRQLAENILETKSIPVQGFAQLSCRDNNRVYLSNGFSIDRDSCATIEAQRRIELATNEVEDQISCTMGINPALGSIMLAEVLLAKPTIYCSSEFSRRYYSERFCSDLSIGPNRNQCVNDFFSNGQNSQAFVPVGVHGELYLASADPQINPNITTNQISSLLFHELLHTCDHPGGDQHNHGDLGDEVYGCQALCTGESQRGYLTKEGCLACLNAEGNIPSARQIAACEQFPLNRIQMHLRRAEKTHRLKGLCLQEINQGNGDCVALFQMVNERVGAQVCPRSDRCVRQIDRVYLQFIQDALLTGGSETVSAMQFNLSGQYVRVSSAGEIDLEVGRHRSTIEFKNDLKRAICSQEEVQRASLIESMSVFLSEESILCD